MNIVHDRSCISRKHKDLMIRGFAQEDLHCLRLSFMDTAEERAENQRLAESGTPEDHAQKALQRSAAIYKVVEVIAAEFVCYQFDPECKMPYESGEWDLFFWCNVFQNTSIVPALQGHDYSYVTLTFNEKHEPAKRKSICDQVLVLIEQKFPCHPNLHLAIQYEARVDTKKVRETAKRVLPSLLNRPSVYCGMEGKLIQTEHGVFFRKKWTRKYWHRLTALEILQLSFMQDDDGLLLPDAVFAEN